MEHETVSLIYVRIRYNVVSFEKYHILVFMSKRGLPVDKVWTVVKVSGSSYLQYIATDNELKAIEELAKKHEFVYIVGTLTSNKRSPSGVVLQFLSDHPEYQQPYENTCAICSGPYQDHGND